jgi:hypothetical protein
MAGMQSLSVSDREHLGPLVFSIIMTPTLAHVNAQWCYRHESTSTSSSTVDYHMTKLSGRELDEVEDVVRLRRNINYILDWGLLRRRLEIKEDLKGLKKRVGEKGAESHARRQGRG